MNPLFPSLRGPKGARRYKFGGGGGGSPDMTTITQNRDPWGPAQPALQYGIGEAQRLYGQGPQQYFPDSTVVPFSNQTEQALTGMEGAANNRAGGVIDPTISHAQNVIGGGMLNANPYVDRMFDQAAGRVRSQVGAHFAGGAPNSMEQYTLGSGLNDLATNIYGGNYANERAAQDRMASQAGSIEALRYQPSQQLAQVGAAREGQAGAELQGDIQRHNFEQQAPQDALARYMALVGGGQFGTNTTQQPIYSNPAALYGGLGIGLLGALGPYLS